MNFKISSSPLAQTISRAVLRMLSWDVEVTPPGVKKYVIIGAPHTTNWDLFFALLFMHATGFHFNWVGKDSLFRWPLGGLMRWLGGIPVNRRSRNNFVQQVVDAFNSTEEMAVAIAPEGTRSKVPYWKTGFYYIAHGAQVPIVMGFIDYSRKVVGIGPGIFPTGDIQVDFATIAEFYADKVGKNQHLQSIVQINPA